MSSSQDKCSDDSAPRFSVLGTDAAFSSRSTDIFATLDTIEAKHVAEQTARSRSPRGREDKELLKDDPVEDAAHRGRPGHRSDNRAGRPRYHGHWREPRDSNRSPDSGGFKRPRGVPHRSRKTPDYHKNPESWTCYDLSTVSSDQMSDNANTAAAFDFIRSRQQQASACGSHDDEHDADKRVISLSRHRHSNKDVDDQNEEMESMDAEDDSESSAGRIMFKKPKTNAVTMATNEDDKTKSTFRGRTRLMPEYIVGASKPKAKPRTVQMTPEPETSTGKLSESVSLFAASSDDDNTDRADTIASETEKEAAVAMETTGVRFKSRKKGKSNIRRRQKSDSDEDEFGGVD